MWCYCCLQGRFGTTQVNIYSWWFLAAELQLCCHRLRRFSLSNLLTVQCKSKYVVLLLQYSTNVLKLVTLKKEIHVTLIHWFISHYLKSVVFWEICNWGTGSFFIIAVLSFASISSCDCFLQKSSNLSIMLSWEVCVITSVLSPVTKWRMAFYWLYRIILPASD